MLKGGKNMEKVLELTDSIKLGLNTVLLGEKR